MYLDISSLYCCTFTEHTAVQTVSCSKDVGFVNDGAPAKWFVSTTFYNARLPRDGVLNNLGPPNNSVPNHIILSTTLDPCQEKNRKIIG